MLRSSNPSIFPLFCFKTTLAHQLIICYSSTISACLVDFRYSFASVTESVRSLVKCRQNEVTYYRKLASTSILSVLAGIILASYLSSASSCLYTPSQIWMKYCWLNCVLLNMKNITCTPMETAFS